MSQFEDLGLDFTEREEEVPRPKPSPPQLLPIDRGPLSLDFVEERASFGEKVDNVGSAIVRGATSVVADVPKALGTVKEALGPFAIPLAPAPVLLTPSGKKLQNVGDSIHQYAQEKFPSDPVLQGDFWWDMVPEGIGSFGAFLIASSLTGPLAPVTATGLGVSTGISETRSRLDPFVREGELTEEAANRWALLGVGPGLLEVLPVTRAIRRLSGKTASQQAFRAMDKAAQTILARGKVVGKEATLNALEEMSTEMVGQFAQNIIEKSLTSSDIKFYEGVMESGGVGGVVGFLAGVATTAIGLRKRGRLKVGESNRRTGEKVLVAQALVKGVISEAEAKEVEGDLGLLFRLAEARYANNEARIVEVDQPDGTKVKRVRARPDVVTWQERVALEHNENLIKELQKGRREKGLTAPPDYFDRTGPQARFVLPISRDAGYLRPPSKLTDNLRLRERIAVAQRGFSRDLQTLRGVEMSNEERALVAMRLDAEFASKMERILRKDDDTEKSAKKEVLREIEEVGVEDSSKAQVEKVLLEAIEREIKGKPQLRQREIVETLLETVQDPTALEVLRSLHRKMLTSFRRRPWSERVGMGTARLKNLDEAMKRRPQFVKDLLKRRTEMRRNLANLVKDSLPPELRGNLLAVIAKAETAKQFGDVVQRIHNAMIKYKRDSGTERIIRSLKNLSKNPRKAEVIELLRKKFDRRVGVEAATPPPARKKARKKVQQELNEQITFEQKLRQHDLQRKHLAKNPTKFRSLSPGHDYLDKRLAFLERKGALDAHSVTLLRYIFAETDPEILSKLLEITTTSKNVGGSFDLFPVPTLRVRSYGGDAKVFLHEYGHFGYYVYLTEDEIRTVKQVFNNLSEEQRIKIVRDAGSIAPEYHASNPAEFFAELYSSYILQKKSPPSSLWVELFNNLAVKLLNIVRIALAGPDLGIVLPKDLTDIFDAIHKGDEPGRTSPFENPILYYQERVRNNRDIKRAALRHPKSLYSAWMVKLADRALEYYKKNALVLGLATPPQETPPSPPIIHRTETGADRINITELRKRLKAIKDPVEVKLFSNELARVVRQGQLERGLYNKRLRFVAEQDSKEARTFLAEKAIKKDWWKRGETVIAVSKTIADPVTIEGWLHQITGGDTNSVLYRVLHDDFVKPYSDAAKAQAKTRQHIDKLVKKHYGHKRHSVPKFVKYLNERLEGGITRGEAMWAYALFTDEGRQAAIVRDGIAARGKKFDLEKSLGLLSEADKAFVRESKTYFQEGQPFVEKAFSTFLFLNGYESERSPSGWFTSRRDVEVSRLAKNTQDYALSMQKSINALEARKESAKQPFRLDGGYLPAYFNVADRLATYGELGLPLYRAERLVNNPEFKNDFINRYGEERYNSLVLYLRNILGYVGHNPTAIDRAMTFIPQAWLASKITLNWASALRQMFSLFTAVGDDILDTSAIVRSFSEGSMFNRRVGREMRENSGIAYLRLNIGRWAEHILVLGHKKVSTRGAIWQDRSFVLQRIADDWALRVTYRAAEIMADQRGLKGQARIDFIVDHFERALTRNQATNSPLHASELELFSKVHPVVRGALALQRELNRLYNVPRRHVVTAAQKPTPENMYKAFKSLFWTGVVNTVASQGLNAIRVIAFGGLAWSGQEWMKRLITDLFGRWYLAGDVATALFMFMDDEKEHLAVRQLLNPAMDTIMQGFRGLKAATEAVSVAGLEESDPESFYKSGRYKGRDRFDVQLEKALDSGLAVTSAAFGLPMWMMWYYAKGVYNWKRDHVRLAANLEVERTRLRKAGETNTARWKEIERVNERINEINRKRIRGVYSAKEAQSLIAQELELDALTRE